MCRGQSLPVESFALTYAHWFSTYPSNSVSVCLCPSHPSSPLSVFFTSFFPLFFPLLAFSSKPSPLWLYTSWSISGFLSFCPSLSFGVEFEASGWGMRQREMRVIKRGMKDWTVEGWVWLHAIWLPCGRPLVTVSCLPNTLHFWITAGYTHTYPHSDIQLLSRCKSQAYHVSY